MGSLRICFCCHRNNHLIISLLFLLLSSSSAARLMVEGRAITSKLREAGGRDSVEEMKVVIRRQAIGSSPPRCDRRCSSCGHCEAIQVPVTTQARSHRRRQFSSANAISTIAYSRGDDISNYKPISWKCKCGDLIFNP